MASGVTSGKKSTWVHNWMITYFLIYGFRSEKINNIIYSFLDNSLMHDYKNDLSFTWFSAFQLRLFFLY